MANLTFYFGRFFFFFFFSNFKLQLFGVSTSDVKELMSSIKNSNQRFQFEEHEENGENVYPDYIDRPTSAPPNLEMYENMNRNSILNMPYIQDIRSHPMYEKFYFQYGDPSLPPPFSMTNHTMYNNNQYSLFGKVCTNSFVTIFRRLESMK